MKQERTFQGGCKRGTARICCRCAPCCGAGRAAINRYHLHAGPTAANPPHAAAVGEWDRQTDRRTPYRCIDAHYAGSANKTRWPIVTVGAVDVRAGDDDAADDVVLPEVDRPPGICGVAGGTRRCRQVAVDCGPCPRYVQAQLTCGSRQRQVV